MFIQVFVSNVTIQCDPASDTSFRAAQILAANSSSFLSALKALPVLGVSGNILIGEMITVSEQMGWPAWGSPPIMLAQGTSLTISSQTGYALMDFTMMADRIVVPPPGILRISNILATNLCTWRPKVGPTGVTVYMAFMLFPFYHNWDRNATRAMYVKNTAMIVPRTELEMLIYW